MGSLKIGLSVALILIGFLLSACGGGDDEVDTPPPAPPPAAAPAAPGEGTVGAGQAETTRDVPLSLNLDEPVPPGFREAYQRRALITVQFYRLGQDGFYPQGLEPDVTVSDSMEQLRAEYPTIEFFSYEITNPGSAESSDQLESGQYGTLAAQLGVGITPFVAMLAPGGDEYVITNLYQGYVPQAVLSQALFDLSAVQVEDNTSDVNVEIAQIELTESGGGIEYVKVENLGEDPVDLQGFSLRVLEPETGQVSPDSPGVTINDPIELPPRRSASIGRVPDIVDADGERVVGTFSGGEALDLAPGDQVALLDAGGAVASTLTV
ncbi:MAG TPA: hypothetical protein VK869_00410 [Rubrobacteraceae bacterium]|nr:hypothetical protein [Rubrobacteraceae bacterium]